MREQNENRFFNYFKKRDEIDVENLSIIIKLNKI